MIQELDRPREILEIEKFISCPNEDCKEPYRVGINPNEKFRPGSNNLYYCHSCGTTFD